MRIAIITGTKDFGGAEHHAIKLAEWLNQRPHVKVEFWGISENDVPLLRAKQKGVNTRVITDFVRFQKGIALLRQLYHYRKFIRKFKPDAIIAFNFLPSLWVGLVGKFAGVPVRIWSQQSVFKPKPKYKSRTDKYSIKNVTAFICNAHHLSNHLRNQLPVKRDKRHFFAIGNGVDKIPQIESDEYWFNTLQKNKHSFVVTMVANLTDKKDHATLIYAWKKVIDKTKYSKHTPVLALAGRFSVTYEALRKKVEKLNLSDNVLFLGMVNDIGGLNKHSNLGVLSSLSEGMPNSVQEQMLHGLPIVGTNNAGTAEAVGKEMEQFLSPPKDPNDLAEKILLFINNTSLCLEVGKKNKHRIENHFTVHKMGEDTLRVFEKLLAERKKMAVRNYSKVNR